MILDVPPKPSWYSLKLPLNKTQELPYFPSPSASPDRAQCPECNEYYCDCREMYVESDRCDCPYIEHSWDYNSKSKKR